MTRVQWQAFVVPGGAVVDLVADDQTTTPTLSIESPSDLPSGVTPAAFVEPTTATPEQICDALIAAGLMAAS